MRFQFLHHAAVEFDLVRIGVEGIDVDVVRARLRLPLAALALVMLPLAQPVSNAELQTIATETKRVAFFRGHLLKSNMFTL